MAKLPLGAILCTHSSGHGWFSHGPVSKADVGALCCAILKFMLADPKSVKVNLTTGTGVEIEWKDGHRSSYTFAYLRDACPCALCDEERSKTGRLPGDPPKLAPEALPMFKPAAKPVSAEPIGKYAIKFNWNDGHELGMYSWAFLRDWCPCAECKAARGTVKAG